MIKTELHILKSSTGESANLRVLI